MEERTSVLIGFPPHEPIGRADLQVCPTNRFVGAMREEGLGNSLPARASQGEEAKLDAAVVKLRRAADLEEHHGICPALPGDEFAFMFAHDQHGTRGTPHDVFGDASQENVLQPGMSMRGNHDQVRGLGFGGLYDFNSRRTDPNRRIGLHAALHGIHR